MKIAALFLNGEPPNEIALNFALSHLPDFMICTDGAFNYMKKLKIIPDVIIGDMDSIVDTPTNIDIHHIENQDTTDFEKALHFLRERDFDEVLVLGSTGGQNDHFLGNLNAAYKFRKFLKITFFDQNQRFWLTDVSTHFDTKPGKIVSLIPFTETQVISLEGLQYGLKNETLNLLDRVGSRNVATKNRVSINISDGALWIFVAY